MFKRNFQNQRGYTIIETMIALSIFLIVVMIGMGALLNANSVHQKSRDMRSILDGLSFSMEDMSRNLRTGTDYHCIDGTGGGNIAGTAAYSCLSGGGGISFKSKLDGKQWIYGIFPDENGNYILKKSVGGEAFEMLTPVEVKIDSDSGFYVKGAELDDDLQPFVTIKLSGKISYKNTDVPFSLQTSISQRDVDI